jgi:hypothetical protein
MYVLAVYVSMQQTLSQQTLSDTVRHCQTLSDTVRHCLSRHCLSRHCLRQPESQFVQSVTH